MKRIITCVLALTIALLTLCACGDRNNGNTNAGGIVQPELPELTIGVGIGAAVQKGVFEGMITRINAKGYKLVYKEYKTPEEATRALADGKIDMSCFGTRAQFTEFEKNNPDVLLSLGSAYYFPYGIYLCNYEKKEDIAAGSTVYIPDDSEGIARSLLLLEANGYIKLKEGAGLAATLDDIEDNVYDLNITAKPADTLAENTSTHTVDLVVMSSQTAIDAGLSVTKTACAIESIGSIAAKENATVLLIRRDALTSEKISAVEPLFFSPLMYDLIDDYPKDLVVPAFSISMRG